MPFLHCADMDRMIDDVAQRFPNLATFSMYLSNADGYRLRSGFGRQDDSATGNLRTQTGQIVDSPWRILSAAARRWPSMPSVRLCRTAGGATAATPRSSSHWCVQTLT